MNSSILYRMRACDMISAIWALAAGIYHSGLLQDVFAFGFSLLLICGAQLPLWVSLQAVPVLLNIAREHIDFTWSC